MKNYSKPACRVLEFSILHAAAQYCLSSDLGGQQLTEVFDFETCGTIGRSHGGAAALFCMSGLEDLSQKLEGFEVVGTNGVSGRITGPCFITEPEFKGADVCPGLFYVCPMEGTSLANEQECLLSLNCEGAAVTTCSVLDLGSCQVVAERALQSEEGRAIMAGSEDLF